MTDTARYADVVLPATTQLEHLDVVPSWGQHYLAYNEPAIAPVGDAKPNTEIFRLLAGRLGFDDPCFEDTDAELLDEALITASKIVDVELLRTRGWVKVDLGDGDAPHAAGGFGTEDGKLAIPLDDDRSDGTRSAPDVRPSRRDRRHRAGGPLPVRAPVTQEPLLLELDVREPASTTRRAR